MVNLTVARWESYLTHLRSGIKPDTLAALETSPLHMATLFPDIVLKKTKVGIASFESKGHSSSSHKKGHYHPFERQEKRPDSIKSDKPTWKNIGSHGHGNRQKGKENYYSLRPTKGQSSYK